MSVDAAGKPNRDTSPRPGPGEPSSFIALFDFDGTVTHCDSLMPFLRFAVGRARFWTGMIRLAPHLLSYGLGKIDRAELKNAVFRKFIGGWSVVQLKDKAERYTRTVLPTLCKAEALARMDWHHEQGHRVVLVSASPEIYLVPWAELLPIDFVLATRLETHDGGIIGQIHGKNCRGAEKVARITENFGKLEDCEIFAYGDSAGDQEMLALATHAHYRPFRSRGAALVSIMHFLKALI